MNSNSKDGTSAPNTRDGNNVHDPPDKSALSEASGSNTSGPNVDKTASLSETETINNGNDSILDHDK